MNITKTNKDTIGIIGLIISSLGFLSGIVFWIFPFEEISKNESIVLKIKENLYLFLIITFVLIILSLVLLRFRTKTKNKEQEVPITEGERKTLIKSLKSRYSERYKQKLDNRFPINLEFHQYTLQGIREKQNISFDDDKNIRNEKVIRTALVNLLEKHSFLLILGEPGIGKTSQLLNLGIGLLEKCEEKDELPIPIILNLATFTDEYEQFEDWLQSNLVSMYDFPPKAVANILKTNKIIPLLDGFDEIGNSLENEEEKKKLRVKCFNAIQKYKMSELNPRQFVICSRIIEYEQTESKAPVEEQIKIKKPEIEQIKNLLKKAIKESSKNSDVQVAKNLLIQLEKMPALKEVLCIPFYYNALMQTLHELQDENIDFPNDIDQLKEFIVNLYIDRKLHNNKPTKYTAENTKKYLGWLSIWLNEQSKVNFELVDFQPNCLKKKRLYSFINRLCYFLSFFIIFQWSMDDEIAKKINLSISTTTIFVAIGCSIISLFANVSTIETEEILKWNWKNLIKLENWLVATILFVLIDIPFCALFYVVLEAPPTFLFIFLFFHSFTMIIFGSFDFYNYTSINKPYTRLSNMKSRFYMLSFEAIGIAITIT